MNTDKIYAESIANEYSKKEASKVVALKKLDKKVKLGPGIMTYAIGVVATLVLGVGMCLCMGVLGGGGTGLMATGAAIGAVGMAGMGVNYPVYKKVLNKQKEKYAGDIISLAKEITEAE